jgi:hypothetical protein
METIATVPHWVCPSCGVQATSPFCPGCGERPVQPFDLSLKGILAQAMKVIGGVDGRLVRSVRALLQRPGSLTEAYAQGRRKPFVGPFQLFLLANLAFFAGQSLTRTKIFSSSLDSHLHHQDWSELAQAMVARHLAATNTRLEIYAPIFDHAVVLNAKSLVILMVLPFAVLLPVVFLRSARAFSIHVVFALHLYAFLLLVFCVSLAISAIDMQAGGAGLQSARMDTILTSLNLGACAIYVWLAAGRVYGVRGVARVVQSLVVTAAVLAILLGYRFAIFAITLYTTAPP